MRQVIVGLILAYQRLAPDALRQRCIFAESCSHLVLRTAREDGARAAVAALRLRFRCCRPGYFRLPPSSAYPEINCPVRLADGSIVDAGCLSGRALRSL